MKGSVRSELNGANYSGIALRWRGGRDAGDDDRRQREHAAEKLADGSRRAGTVRHSHGCYDTALSVVVTTVVQPNDTLFGIIFASVTVTVVVLVPAVVGVPETTPVAALIDSPAAGRSHLLASTLLDDGYGIHEVAERLGRDPGTLMRYYTRVSARRRQATVHIAELIAP